jgi:hypothetical protein
MYRCPQIREFRIQSVVGDHFSSPNMEKKIGTPPTKIHWSEGAHFDLVFFKYGLKISLFVIICGVDD